jgi:hypothetical protein
MEESFVLRMIWGVIAVAITAWLLIGRLRYHRRALRIVGVWQGLKRGDGAKSPHTCTVIYNCPITNKKQRYTAISSVSFNSWRRIGDPYLIFIDPKDLEHPRNAFFIFSTSTVCLLLFWISLILFRSAITQMHP